MEELSRREAVKMVAVGVTAAGIGALAANEAPAQEAAKDSPAGGAGSGKTIPAIKFPVGFGSVLGGSPEDAAKAFIRAASVGLAQVVANSLVQAVGDSVGAAPTPPDWIKYIKGVVINLAWETPGSATPTQGLLFAKPEPSVGGGSSVLGGFEISVGGTWKG